MDEALPARRSAARPPGNATSWVTCSAAVRPGVKATRERLRFGLYAAHLLTLFGIALSNIALGVAALASRCCGIPPTRSSAGPSAARPRPGLRRSAHRRGPVLAGPGDQLGGLRELFTLAALPLALGSVGERAPGALARSMP